MAGQHGREIGGAWSPVRWNSLQGIDQEGLLELSLEQGGDRPDEAGTIIRFVAVSCSYQSRLTWLVICPFIIQLGEDAPEDLIVSVWRCRLVDDGVS